MVCLPSGSCRMFHTAVATGEFVSGPDHRKWATLPPNFASNPAFMTDHRSQYATAGHYAHAYLGQGADGLPSINSSFGKVQGRQGAARSVIDARRPDVKVVAP
jgi:hypothetical protein